MLKSETENEPKNDDFSRIFSEYRARIDEISRRTEKRFKSLNDELPETPAAVAEPPAQVPPAAPTQIEEEKEEAEAEPAPPPYRPDARPYPILDLPDQQQPLTESAETLRQARQQAKKIIEEAEQKVKKEAKKKTQSQVEKIMERARKEAEEIVASTRQAAEDEKDQIIEMSRREAEHTIAEITEKCRQESEARASRSITEARQRAQQIMADIIENSTEIGRVMSDILERAGRSVAEFEARLREDSSDLARIISETRARLEEISTGTRDEETPAPAPDPSGPAQQTARPALLVHFNGERSNGKNGTPVLFLGQIEMKSSSAVDYQYLKSLKKYLVTLPSVKYLQEYASEKEMSVLFDIREPLPLMEVLRQIPFVENVVNGGGEDFNIIFRNAG